jgi:hypothetical protein
LVVCGVFFSFLFIEKKTPLTDKEKKSPQPNPKKTMVHVSWSELLAPAEHLESVFQAKTEQEWAGFRKRRAIGAAYFHAVVFFGTFALLIILNEWMQFGGVLFAPRHLTTSDLALIGSMSFLFVPLVMEWLYCHCCIQRVAQIEFQKRQKMLEYAHQIASDPALVELAEAYEDPDALPDSITVSSRRRSRSRRRSVQRSAEPWLAAALPEKQKRPVLVEEGKKAV